MNKRESRIRTFSLRDRFTMHIGIFSRVLLLFTVGFLCLASSSSQADLLLDTFSDDTPDLPPNGPEIGSATYWYGTHIVFDRGNGDLALRSWDSSTSGSLMIEYVPTNSADLIQVEYQFRIESGSVLIGLNAFNQELVLRPPGANLQLGWSDTKECQIWITRPGEPTITIDTDFSWELDRDYHVTWFVNMLTDRFSLSIDGTPLVLDESVGVDLTGLYLLYFDTNYPTTGSQVIDDVVISQISHLENMVDIKPGSCPNRLNVKDKGLLSVAILGMEDFDVSIIDIPSIRLSGVAPVRSSYEDVTTPVPYGSEICECTTDGPDGYLDLTLKFKVQEIITALGEVNDREELELTLTGVLNDGTPIEGKDCIVIVSKGKSE